MPFSGGYFLTMAVDRPEYVTAELLPSRLLSLSDCICDFIPNVWAVEWASVEAEQRVAEALKFNVPSSALPDIVNWTTERMNTGALGWPCVFFSTRDARDFARRFLNVIPDLKLLGIALHTDLVDEFLSEEKPGPSQGEPGIYTAISSRKPLEPGGSELGWEVLCYEYGGFHSWLCNSLESDVAKKCGIKPGAAGFIASANDALAAAEYCGREDVGAEPGFWAPWLVMEYSLGAVEA